MKKDKVKKVQIGEVGVDSGQLMLCDPCYIKEEWIDKPLNIARVYEHKDGTIIKEGVDFTNFEGDKIKKYGLSMNALIATKQVKDISDQFQTDRSFSYNGCCCATLSEQRGGQLVYKLGHAGAGVAVSTGFGDGCYPVFADIVDGKRVARVYVEFFDPETDI